MTSGLVLLDNTVLTNFALVDRPDLVLELWDTNCATTTEVMAEYQAGIVGHGLPAHSWENLAQLTVLCKKWIQASLRGNQGFYSQGMTKLLGKYCEIVVGN